MDEMVLEVQKWLNETYTGKDGYTPVPEDGQTGKTTVDALIIGLQIEIGVASPKPNFGPSTKEKFPGISKQDKDEEPTNLNMILQGGFWCKGYNPGGFTGKFLGDTEDKVKDFEADVGLDPTGYVDAKLMKAILNTDGFKQAFGYPSYIRTMQQLLNRDYSRYFDYIPTNGNYERKTNEAIIYALQHESGIGDIANGNFGPSTISNTPTLIPGNDNEEQNRVLQFALAANGYYQSNLYDGNYSDSVESAVREFQEFMTLPVTGVASMPTIKQLLTSNGWTGRTASACDTSTILDQDTALTLVDSGYEIVGRYLTGTVGGSRSKAMTPNELATIEHAGLRVFPIYQDGGHEPEHFVEGQGTVDAYKAIRSAHQLGFESGTTIYFTVDFDAYDFHIKQSIIPYMAEIRNIFDTLSDDSLPSYKLGIYGPRNVCIQCANDTSVLADNSFVANMSTGFSGNLGFPMPENWSFGQFHELTIGSGDGSIAIDKNDYSGRDTGVYSVLANEPAETTPEYEARLDIFQRIASKFPALNGKPSLFTTGINFDSRYPILRSPIADIDLVTSTTFTQPGETENSVVLSINDGGFDLSMKNVLGNAYSELKTSQINDYKNILDNLSASLGNGWLEVEIDDLSDKLIIKTTAYKDDIPVEGGEPVQLEVSVEYTIKIDTRTPKLDPLLGSETVAVMAIGLGIIAIFGSSVITGGATAVAASFIIAFLLGNHDGET